MHLGGIYKISWSNDVLESFLQIRALCAPHESITSQGAMADRVKEYKVNQANGSEGIVGKSSIFLEFDFSCKDY